MQKYLMPHLTGNPASGGTGAADIREQEKQQPESVFN